MKGEDGLVTANAVPATTTAAAAAPIAAWADFGRRGRFFPSTAAVEATIVVDSASGVVVAAAAAVGSRMTGATMPASDPPPMTAAMRSDMARLAIRWDALSHESQTLRWLDTRSSWAGLNVRRVWRLM